MKWITRERPKIDRIACPWLIQKFIDERAEFLYVPSIEVFKVAAETGAIPYDIPGAELTHENELCSFDSFIKKYNLKSKALTKMAEIVRAADTDNLQNSKEAAGLLAISLGLSFNFSDDHEMLKVGMHIYEALYSWCENLVSEKHGWQPDQIKL